MYVTLEGINMTIVLADRTMSAFPVSIGTSLALETLADGPNEPYDPNRLIPTRFDLSQYDEFWVNSLTLFRNIIGALPKNGFNGVMPNDICDIIEFEVDIIKQLVKDITYEKTKVVIYASDYAGLERKYPHSRLRNDTTEKQKIYTALLVKSIGAYFKKQAKSDFVKHFHLEIKPKVKNKVLTMTSYAYDLLSEKNFLELDLLESHTGVLKKKDTWNTKYLDHKNLTRIPFNETFLQVFGDSSTFLPWPKETRENIIALAEKNKWTNVTNKERIKLNIKNLIDPYTITILLQMLK